jgi:hypothetical protein
LAREHEVTLTRLRLVKFIYLADLYFARVSKGETLTGLPWAFVYYGPYCSAVLEEIEAAVAAGFVNEEARESKYEDKDYYLYHSVDEVEPEMKGELPFYVMSELRHAIKKWGEDSHGLLDHVYFETEPMRDVRKGDHLDFTSAQMPSIERPIRMKQLSKKNIERAKEAIRKLTSKTTTLISRSPIRDEPKHDKYYYDFLQSIEEADLEARLDGTAEIKD